jgi:diguanylate cyclase (GGDEF)-like protein
MEKISKLAQLFRLYALRQTAAIQVESLLSSIPSVVFGHTIVTLFTAYICWGGAATAYVWTWASAMILGLVPTVLAMLMLRRQETGVEGATAQIALRLTVMASFRAALWAIGLAVLMPLVNEHTSLLLEFVMFGMIVGGIFTYWVLPAASLAYSTLVLVGSLVGIWNSQVNNAAAMTFVLVISYLFFNRVALTHASNIRSQHESAVRLQDERQVVSLLLRDFEDGSKDWLWEIDETGCVIRGASGFANALGVARELFQGEHLAGAFEVLGISIEQLNAVKALREALATGLPFVDLELSAGDGAQTVYLSLTAKPQSEETSAGRQWHGVASNISVQRKAEAAVKHLALFDPLTKLPNRTQLRQILAAKMEEGRETPLWVAYGDLDGFKTVNDTLGHAAGDCVLQELASRFHQRLRPSECVARIGGDEFVFLLEGTKSDIEKSWAILAGAANEPVVVGNQPQHVGLSLGIVNVSSDSTVDELLRRADLALYNAKQQSKGTAQFYVAEMDKVAQARREMEKALRGALANKEFAMHYQPIYQCNGGKLSSYEALIRWNHPIRGFISPADFIPLAEECGLISDIGAWVLRQACGDARTFPAGVGISVNISAYQMKSRRLLADVTNALAFSGLRPAQLELEMTESALVENTDHAESLIKELKALGVGIALDDFGTGYSSLAYLHRFKFDRIKIDRSFVQAYAERHESRAVVDAVIMIGRELGIGAEGIETQEQYNAMAKKGCDLAQGYLLGRPAPLQSHQENLATA